MSRTRLGTQVYAVGGNIKAAHLSAINTKKTLMLAYIICALIASLTGLLLDRSRGIWRSKSRRNYRTGIYRSLRYRRCIASWWYRTCGECRAWRVLHHLVQNGMNLAQVSSYMQMVLLGSLLILAVIFDQLRYRMIMSGT